MEVCLIGLEKQPVVRPVRIGETWRHCFAKCASVVAGLETKEAWGTDQLYGGMEAVIEEVIYYMSLLWQHNS